MEAREVRYFEFEDKHGENGEFVFTLRIPINASWEMTHVAAANIVNGLKEWEQVNKKRAEEAQEASDPAATEAVTDVAEEVTAEIATS